MAMHGKLEDLNPLVHPGSRLRRGLELLAGLLTGRLPEVMSEVSTLRREKPAGFPWRAMPFICSSNATSHEAAGEGRFEAHERHTDLQFLWSGRECIEVCDLRTALPAVAYDENGNVYFPMGNQAHSRLLLQAGEVAVLLPGDAHAACLSLGWRRGGVGAQNRGQDQGCPPAGFRCGRRIQLMPLPSNRRWLA